MVDVKLVVGRSKLLEGRVTFPCVPRIEVVRYFANTKKGMECQCRHFRMEFASGISRGCWGESSIDPFPDLIAMFPLAYRLVPILGIDMRHPVNILISKQLNKRKKFTSGS